MPEPAQIAQEQKEQEDDFSEGFEKAAETPDAAGKAAGEAEATPTGKPDGDAAAAVKDRVKAEQDAADKAKADAEAAGGKKPDAKPDKPEPTTEEQIEQASAQLEAEQQERAFWSQVEAAVPGALEIAQSPEFQAWLKAQPEQAQKDANSPNAAKGIAVLAQFQRSHGQRTSDDGNRKPDAAKPAAAVDEDDFEFEVDGEKYNRKRFLDDYGPTLDKAIEARARKIVERMLKGAPREAEKAVQAAAQLPPETQERIDQLLFWDAVADEHPDGRRISRSKEFKDWLTTKSEAVQRVAKYGRDPGQAIIVLNLYKQEQAAAAGDRTRGRARDAKRDQDDLHLHTGRAAPRQQAAQPGEPDEEFSRGFNEA